MKKRARSPQEKKALSYVKDRRNVYAEMRSIAHRAISKRKAMANQAFRTATKQAVGKELRGRATMEDVDPFVARTGARSWRKSSDAPLATYLEMKLESRPRRGMSSKAKRSPPLTAARRKVRERRGF